MIRSTPLPAQHAARTAFSVAAAAAVVLIASTAAPGCLAAQDAVLPPPAQCTWDECALRIRAPTLTTGMKLVRGRDAIDVVPLGLFQPAIAPLVAGSDSAAAYARVYDVMYDRGSLISLTGTAISIIAPIVMKGTMQKIAFTGVGIGFTVIGGAVTNRANESLHQAVWWYNRELQR